MFDGRRFIGDGDGEVDATGPEGAGSKKEDGEGGDCIVLTGVLQRGRIGLLTLYEAYKHVEVHMWQKANYLFHRMRQPVTLTSKSKLIMIQPNIGSAKREKGGVSSAGWDFLR